MRDYRLRQKADPLSGRSGMTLVETMAAMLVLSICMAGMCALVMSVKAINDRARDHYTAINLAKNRTERAKMFEFSEIPSFTEAGTVMDKNGAPTSAGRFKRITSVTTASSNLYEIVVEVKIKDRKTLAFSGDSEIVRTYIADLQLGPPEAP